MITGINKKIVIKPITIIINKMINTEIFHDKFKVVKIIYIFLKKMMKLNVLIIRQYIVYLQYLKYLKELYSVIYRYINLFMIIYFIFVNMDSGKTS